MHNVHWSTEVTTAPTVEPVTRTEAKLWARIDVTDDETLIDNLIKAARESVETFLSRTIINTTRDLFMDRFPGVGDTIVVPFPTLDSVTTLKYLDTAGDQQTLSSADYLVDVSSEPGRITPSPSAVTWPNIEIRTRAVEIRYVAGYGTATSNVPEGVRTAILMRVSDMYEHRETQSEIRLTENTTVKRLLWAHKAARIS